MKRTLAIGDIHGGFRALIQVLEKANVTENDTLIFLGDYVDGWSESSQVMKFLIELSEMLQTSGFLMADKVRSIAIQIIL
jgi:serine/threonine protein phosphatase 1